MPKTFHLLVYLLYKPNVYLYVMTILNQKWGLVAGKLVKAKHNIP